MRACEMAYSAGYAFGRLCPKAGALQPYSITSSARASNACSTVSPSAYAVLRLITKSNFVGCSTSRNEQACSNFL